MPTSDSELRLHHDAEIRRSSKQSSQKSSQLSSQPTSAPKTVGSSDSESGNSKPEFPACQRGAIRTTDTAARLTKIIMPPDTNPYHITFGGTILKWMEECAYISAMRFCRPANVLVVSMDFVRFIAPTRVGDLLLISSYVSYSYGRSCEVFVRVEAVDLRSGIASESTKRIANEGFFTFVAMNEQNLPTHVPPLTLVTDEEVRRSEQAPERKRLRLLNRNDYRQTLSGELYRDELTV